MLFQNLNMETIEKEQLMDMNIERQNDGKLHIMIPANVINVVKLE